MSRLFPERTTVSLTAPGEVQTWRWRSHCRVTVVLSLGVARYTIVPWSDALDDDAEEEAYVRHHFARVHGERAQGWALRWEPAGTQRLASAIDGELLLSIRESLAATKAKLVSVQPSLMFTANRFRRAIPTSGAWLVLVEQERTCVALHVRGEWRTVRTARGDWLPLLERERHRVHGEAPNLALLAGARRDREAPGWRLEELPV